MAYIFLPRPEIPLFGGKDVDGWLSQMEMFFDRHGLFPEQKLSVIHNYLDGEATQWYYEEMWLGSKLPSWENFIVDIRHRFHPLVDSRSQNQEPSPEDADEVEFEVIETDPSRMVKSEVVDVDPSLMVESVVVEGDPWTQRVMMTRFLGGGGYEDGMRAKRAQQPIQQPHGHLQSLVTSSLTTVELEMVDLSVANWEKLFTDVDGADTNLVFEKLVSSPTTVDIKPVVEENLIWYKMETITRSEMVIDNCYWMLPERGIMRFRRVRLEVLKEKPRVKIKDMVSRGAPTIAIAATLPLSVEVSNLSELDGLSKDAVAFRVVKLKYLISIRHTAVILADATSKLEEITNKAGAIVFESRGIVYAYIEASEIMLVDNVASNKSSGVYRVEPELPHKQLKKSDKIFIVTYCKTGELSTADYGIALDVIQVDTLETFSARSLLMKLIVNTTEPGDGVWCLSLTVGSIFNFYVEDVGRDATAKRVFSSPPPKHPDIQSFQRSDLFKHDFDTHRKIIDILGSTSKLNLVRGIFLVMLDKGVPWDDDLFVKMIGSYGKAGIVQGSIMCVYMMKELGFQQNMKAVLFGKVGWLFHFTQEPEFDEMKNEGYSTNVRENISDSPTGVEAETLQTQEKNHEDHVEIVIKVFYLMWKLILWKFK